MFNWVHRNELTLMREDLASMIAFLMRLDAKVDGLLDYFGIDDAGEAEETDH
jgi:hypothetical protein